MRLEDLKKLEAENEQYGRGSFPDIGTRHAKCGYRFSKGLVLGPEGQPVAWRENLGHDKLVAQYRARAMLYVWINHCRDTGGFVSDVIPMDRKAARTEAWTLASAQMGYAHEVAAAFNRDNASGKKSSFPYSPGLKLVVVPVEAPETVLVVPSPSPSTASPTVRPHSLFALATAWLVRLDWRFAQNDLSESYLDRACATVRRLPTVLGDLPLDPLNAAGLDAIRIAYQNVKKRNGKPRKKSTTDTELGHLREMLQWAADEGFWKPFVDWQRRIRAVYRDDELDDDADVDADDDKGIARYSVEELCKIYSASPKSLRTWILCGLNFSWGAREIATARKKHWKLEHQRVARFRGKRRAGAKPIPGRWVSWDETWAMALERMKKTPDDLNLNPKGYAFLTRETKMLVRYTETRTGKRKRHDVPAEALKEVCEKIGIEFKGFYAIRRTAIDMIDEKFGERIADLFCQHRPKSMTSKHYTNRRWRKLFRTLRWLRTELQPMFDAAAARKSEKSAQSCIDLLNPVPITFSPDIV